MDLCIHRKIFAAIAITFSLSGCFNNGFEGLAEVSQTSALREGTFQFSSTGSLLPQAYTGDVYTVMFATSNGVEPVSFSVTSGSLPPGVTLTNYGLLSGMLTASPGDFSFTVQARDAEGSLATKDFSLKVSVPFTFTTRGLPNAILGANYTAVLTAAGGTPPYTFSATGLPAAFTLNPAIGLITGTPTTAGSATVSVTVTDANGWQESGDILLNSIVPVSAVPSITTSSLPNGVVNSNYAGILVVSGGVAPYRFAVASGSLPAGLTLDTNTGLILGTPQTIGVTPFAIRATDAVGATSVVNYTVTVTFKSSASLSVSLPILSRFQEACPPVYRLIPQAESSRELPQQRGHKILSSASPMPLALRPVAPTALASPTFRCH
ncbi:hypothetical protein EBZ37_01800 [bacterium]|nr:hypothetical protein [bacterium]